MAKRRYTIQRIQPDHVSPDDVVARIREARARDMQDTRTPAQVWLGDPAPGRSALAALQLRSSK